MVRTSFGVIERCVAMHVRLCQDFELRVIEWVWVARGRYKKWNIQADIVCMSARRRHRLAPSEFYLFLKPPNNLLGPDTFELGPACGCI